MSFEYRTNLQTEIRNEFKKLSRMTEHKILKQEKTKELEALKSDHNWEYYVDKVYNPSTFPEKMGIEFEVVRVKSHPPKKYRELNDLWKWFKTRTSSLKSRFSGGKSIRILVKEKYTQQYIGLLSLTDVGSRLMVRDNYIGWTRNNMFSKTNDSKHKLINHVVDISTCVPLQPFGWNFNGGKLLAMLCFSTEIQQIHNNLYGYNIAAFQTMGVNGISSMYNNCNLEKGSPRMLKYIGLTAGCGVTGLIPDSLYHKCIEYLKLRNDESLHQPDMFLSKLLKLRTCMRLLNIDTAFLETDIKKGIYIGYTSPESKQFLTGNSNTFSINTMPSSQICSKWMTRWAHSRFASRIQFKKLRYNDASLVQLERQEETKRKTQKQKERRKREREEKDPTKIEHKKKQQRKNNNRVNIRKHLNRQFNATVENTEIIIKNIAIYDLETMKCRDIIDKLDAKYQFKKVSIREFKGFGLKDGWGTIYMIRNKINGKKYIGQVCHFRTKKKVPAGLGKRLEEHRNCINHTIAKSPAFANAISKYGWDNFDKIPLLDCRIEEMDFYECKFIRDYESHISTGKGYNLTWGGQLQRGFNWRTGPQHHLWGKSLPDKHKQHISESNIIAKRKISDECLSNILLLKHTKHTESEVIDIICKKYGYTCSRGLIENIWNGQTKLLDQSKMSPEYEKIINTKRVKTSSCRTPDCIIEDAFLLKFNGLSADETTKIIKDKYPTHKLTKNIVFKIWCGQLKPRFPSEQYNKLQMNNRNIKKRKLKDEHIEEIYFLKSNKIKQKAVVEKFKDKYNITIKQQDVSSVWRKQLKPLIPSKKFTEMFDKDIIKKGKKILNDEQVKYVFSQKGILSAPKIVNVIKKEFDIDVKKSYIHDIWRKYK